MAEELVMTVKSNIKQVTKETEDWGKSLDDVNEQIELQNKEIIAQERELIKLKAQQDKLSKGGWTAGMPKLNEQIKETTTLLNLEKNTLKDLKNQQKAATDEVKKYNKAQKEQDDAVKGTIGNFEAFGISLNGIKKSVSGVIPLIKTMFRSITAGIVSTGIGVFLIAFGSLVTYVTTTKEGMDKLAVVMSKIGAGFNVIKDRITTVGKALTVLFTDGFAAAAEVLEGNMSGIGDEMEREAKAAAQLALDTQALRDATNEFNIAKANTRKEIEKARLLSEDETKSAKVRLDALRNALDLEQETTDTELVLAKERMRIFKEDMEMNKHKAVDEKELADLTTAIAEAEIKSLRLRKRIMTEVNEMENQIEAERKKREKEKQDAIDKENKRIADEKQAAIDAELDEDMRFYKNLTARNKRKKAEDEKAAEDEIALAKGVKDAKLAMIQDGLRLATEIAGQESTIGKAAAVTSATISGVEGVQNAFTSAQKSPITTVLPAYPFIQAGLAGAFSAVQIQKILSGTPAQGGGSGGGGGVAPQTPAPQMMSGAFELGGGLAPEPVKAFVVTDEMTNSQNQLANIRRRATI